MQKEYKHPTPYRPDGDYLTGMNQAKEHIKKITHSNPHPGQAQHLGGMASYHDHLEKLQYGQGHAIKKELKRVVDYLYYYANTGHDIYKFLAEDGMKHVEQLQADIQDQKEKEHVRYFLECVREYMSWLKEDMNGRQNMDQQKGNKQMNSRQNSQMDRERHQRITNRLGFGGDGRIDEYDRPYGDDIPRYERERSERRNTSEYGDGRSTSEYDTDRRYMEMVRSERSNNPNSPHSQAYDTWMRTGRTNNMESPNNDREYMDWLRSERNNNPDAPHSRQYDEWMRTRNEEMPVDIRRSTTTNGTQGRGPVNL